MNSMHSSVRQPPTMQRKALIYISTSTDFAIRLDLGSNPKAAIDCLCVPGQVSYYV